MNATRKLELYFDCVVKIRIYQNAMKSCEANKKQYRPALQEAILELNKVLQAIANDERMCNVWIEYLGLMVCFKKQPMQEINNFEPIVICPIASHVLDYDYDDAYHNPELTQSQVTYKANKLNLVGCVLTKDQYAELLSKNMVVFEQS